MNIPQSINEIMEQKKILQQNIKSISSADIKQFDEQFFGNESEYVYKDLLSEIDGLLKNVAALTKAPKQFLKISTYNDRSTIRDSLININSILTDPNSLFSYLEQLKEVIRPFHPYYTQKRLLDLGATFNEYDEKLEKQNAKYKAYDADIKAYNTEKDEAIASLNNEQKQLFEQAEELIKQAKDSLSLTSSSGIGKFFQERLKVAENAKSVRWIVGAIVFIGIGIVLTFFFILENPSSDFSATLSRLSIVSLPLAGAWFCAGQYIKLKNIAEDYAYKTVLTQSIIGFSKQLKSDDEKDTSYQDYMKKMLDEIHQHPVPKHTKENITLIEKIAEKVKQLNKNNDSDGS